MNAYPEKSSPEKSPERECDLPRATTRLRARIEDLEPLVEELRKRLLVVCRPDACEKANARAAGQPEEVIAPAAAHINESTARLEAMIGRLSTIRTLLEV